jgi:tetratricopeptide (TPR) repeat protein
MKTPFVSLLLVVTVMILAGLSWRSLSQAARVNWLSLQALHALLADPAQLPATHARVQQAAASICRLNWTSGILAARLGDLPSQQADWSAFLSCPSSDAPRLAHAGAPLDPVLAEQAVQIYPDQAEAWFWLAEVSAAEGRPEQAIQHYQRVVQLTPADALAWCRLGFLLYNQESSQSRPAYIRCCLYGDPGSNGCYNAGRLSEQLGDYEQALHYYRRSRWSEAHRLADDLEARLAAEK